MVISTRRFVWATTMWVSLGLLSVPVSAQVPELVPVPMTVNTGGGLPSMGDSESALSWSDERQIGDQIAYEIQKDVAYERDPLLHDYVNGIWQQLLSSALRNGALKPDLYGRMAWKMFLVRDPSVNAFALPGAYIGVNLGLISVSDTRDELASVLAHESVHIFQRHIARMYDKQKDTSLLAFASLIVGALAASVNPNLAGAIFMGGQAAAVQGQIDFTRAMEYEADRLGYTVLVGAGFRPQGMSDMFRMLAEASRHSDTTSFPYLRTHPLNSERIAEAQTRLGIELHDVGRPLDYMHAVMAGRARVLSRSQPDAWRELVHKASGVPVAGQMDDSRMGDLYAGALAAVKLRQFAQADEILAQLAQYAQGKEASVRRVVELLGVEIALAQGDVAMAQQWLRSKDVQVQGAPLMSVPSVLERSELLMQAQVAIAAKQPAQVIGLLEGWVFKHADDNVAWVLLSTAYRMNNQPDLSLRAEGEARMAEGDFGGAIDRFKAALNLSKEYDTRIQDMEVLQSRLRTAQEAQKVQMAFKF